MPFLHCISPKYGSPKQPNLIQTDKINYWQLVTDNWSLTIRVGNIKRPSSTLKSSYQHQVYGCWRRNTMYIGYNFKILVTVMAVSVNNIIYLLTYAAYDMHRASTFKRPSSVTNLHKMSITLTHQHQDVTNIIVAIFDWYFSIKKVLLLNQAFPSGIWIWITFWIRIF